MQVSRNYTDVFLAHWVTSQSAGGFDNTTVSKYLSIYGGIAAVNAVFSFLRSFLFAYGGICAARILHQTFRCCSQSKNMVLRYNTTR